MTLDSKKYCRQKGAVWVEFLVASSTLLIGLFILIPTLAKYMDIRHKTEQAAQYSIWERSVWYNAIDNDGASRKSEVALIKDAKQRVLADGDALVYSGQSSDPIKIDSFHNFIDSKFGTPKYTSLLGKRGEVAEKSMIGGLIKDNQNQPGKDVFDTALTISTAGLQTKVKNVINQKGYYQNNVKLAVKQPSWFPEFTQDSITMTTGKALLVDGWGGGGSEHNKKQVNKLQPRLFTDNPFAKPMLETYKKAFSLAPRIANDLKKLDFDHVDSSQLLNPDKQLGDFYTQ